MLYVKFPDGSLKGPYLTRDEADRMKKIYSFVGISCEIIEKKGGD